MVNLACGEVVGVKLAPQEIVIYLQHVDRCAAI
jgi:hypothetical protein